MLSKELLEEIKSSVDPRGANAKPLLDLIDALMGESFEDALILGSGEPIQPEDEAVIPTY